MAADRRARHTLTSDLRRYGSLTAKENAMSASERFAMHPPVRLQWHPARGEHEGEDPETFHLHVEFVHAHGLPAGQFTTFSTRGESAPVDHDDRDGARRK
jgi:hypothetical protein